MQLQLVFLFVSLISGAFSQTLVTGNCNQLRAAGNFDYNSYLGVWEVYKSSNVADAARKCIRANLTRSGTGNIKKVETYQIGDVAVKLNGLTETLTATTQAGDFDGKLLTILPVANPYLVIGTDTGSTNYAIVARCTTLLNGTSLQNVFYYTRGGAPDEAAEAAFDASDLDLRDKNLLPSMNSIGQTDCMD